MRINLAHMRERAASGGWVNFAVFDARSSSGGRTQFFGSPPLVDFLSKNGIPGWTHTIDA